MNQDKPRIGVYVCMCGSNIAGTVDVNAVSDAVASMKNVVVSRINKYTCAGPGQASIKQDIQEHGLNRVVVSACSPRMHERTWRALLADSGLNPYLLEVANLREHVSWAHPADALTTQKAIDLVGAAVARVAWHDPLCPQRVPVTKAWSSAPALPASRPRWTSPRPAFTFTWWSASRRSAGTWPNSTRPFPRWTAQRAS